MQTHAAEKEQRTQQDAIRSDRGSPSDLRGVVHRSVGNAAAQRRPEAIPDGVRAKLRVNRPGDALEQEADRVADRVMRGPAASAIPSTMDRGSAGPELVHPKEMLQRHAADHRISGCAAWPGATTGSTEAAACFVALAPELQGGGRPPVGEEAAQATVSRETARSTVTSPPAGGGISSPTAVSWASANSFEGEGARAIPGPSIATLAAIQAAAGGNTGAVGATSFPLATAKAPQFDFGSLSSTPGGMGPPSWSSTPSWTQHFDEGNSVCMFLGPARHPTTLTDGGKPVFWNVSAAISTRDGLAEAEHSDDIKRARDISIKEAETVLNDHIIGKTFPATGTRAEAEMKVLDEITSKLTHASLGNDQTMWADIYETLYRKTLTRDNSGWHTFGLGGRTENAAGDVDFNLTNGTTSINTTTSNDLIVY